MRNVAIGLDFGTSSLKLVARDSSGQILTRIRRDYPTARPEPGAAEQDPGDWISACDGAMRELAGSVSPIRWGVIGLSAMLPTLVSLDADLQTRWPAVTWEDARADSAGDLLRSGAGGRALYEATGQLVDGRYLLPMHLRRTDVTDGVVWAVGAKDYLLYRLTGELLTDPSTASGYGAWDLGGHWLDDVLALAGSPGIPSVVPSTEARPLTAEFAELWGCAIGLPVLVGAADSVLGAYGLGLASEGSIAYIAGTSNVIIGWSEYPLPDPQGRSGSQRQEC